MFVGYSVPLHVMDRASLRTILCVLNEHRAHIPLYSVMTAPLAVLLRKGVPWAWTAEHVVILCDLEVALLACQPPLEK